MASIIVETGNSKGDYYPLGHRTTVIGRAESLLVQILDERVSRKHMSISYDAEKDCFTVVDLKSRHGVFVNEIQIKQETVLSDGDRIEIGDTVILFSLRDFDSCESALNHFKRVGERSNPTLTD